MYISISISVWWIIKRSPPRIGAAWEYFASASANSQQSQRLGDKCAATAERKYQQLTSQASSRAGSTAEP